jgi:LuxR family transcriptional regulator, maltose regulon positive regulatory protein
MPRKNSILAKLSQPVLYDVAERPRLFQRLTDEYCRRRAITVTGPPGAGKTTLVASWLDAQDIPALWYQVDPGDADLASFFHYLGMGVRALWRKGGRALPLFAPEHESDLPGFTRRYFRELFSRLPEGAVLVLDNYQNVPQGSSFHRLIAEALEQIPSTLAMVIVSRSALPEPFARAIANGKFAFVEWEDLKLTLDEARELGMRRARLAKEDIAELHAKSGGWMAGMVLLTERIRPGEKLQDPQDPEQLQVIFDYLSEQIFSRQAPAAQAELLKLAIVPTLTADLARELSGSADAVALLDSLRSRHLFVDRRTGHPPVYQFHGLLREFLLSRMKLT